VEVGAPVLAALDPHGHRAPEPGELADLDRSAERARAQLEAEALKLILGERLEIADDGEIEREQRHRVHIGHAQQPPVAQARSAQRIELGRERQLPKGDQHPHGQPDRDGEPEIFGNEIGQHPPHDVDRPPFRHDEIEQAQHAIEQQQHGRERQRAEQRHQDQAGEIAIDLREHRAEVIAPDPKRLQAAPAQF